MFHGLFHGMFHDVFHKNVPRNVPQGFGSLGRLRASAQHAHAGVEQFWNAPAESKTFFEIRNPNSKFDFEI
jgi:hypothetical protein